MELIAGVDDAGRGPVIGPMVIAGVLIHKEGEWELKEMGVKDSKLITPSNRLMFFDEISRVSKRVHHVIVSPNRIDEYVKRDKRLEGLNLLEAEVMAEVINRLEPNVAFVDASDINEQRFGEMISSRLDSEVKVVSEHKADAKYPVVSAASVVAKVIRDREIDQLKLQYGDFGSGYTSDPRTITFLKRYYQSNKCFPPATRLSWKTVEKIKEEAKQSKLM